MAVLLSGGCQDEAPEELWPTSWREGGDPVADAWQVWRLGSGYFLEPPDDDDGSRDIYEFPGFKEWSGKIGMDCKDFLDYPDLQPAVQFSCGIRLTPFEYSLEAALDEGDFHARLQAVTVLMKVRAPRSVPKQWRVLQDLAPLARGAAHRLIEELKGEFRLGKLLPRLSRPPPTIRYSSPEAEFCWSIRAAGVAYVEAALPRLRALSREESIDVSLAAERSLEDFQGADADETLIHCLLGWRYNAAEKAGRTLLSRDKSRLREALLGASAPVDYRYMQGILLAECDSPEAVPILCDTVAGYSQIDEKMFLQIGRLARPEHESLLFTLPAIVREEQRPKAEAAIVEYRKRMAAE